MRSVCPLGSGYRVHFRHNLKVHLRRFCENGPFILCHDFDPLHKALPLVHFPQGNDPTQRWELTRLRLVSLEDLFPSNPPLPPHTSEQYYL